MYDWKPPFQKSQKLLKYREMKSIIIKIVFVLGVLAVLGTLSFQMYWVYSTWEINDKDFTNKVSLALNNVASKIADLEGIVLPTANSVNQETSNYFIVSLDAELDSTVLEFYLREEFARQRLNLDFEYAIFDCTTDQMIYGNYCKYSPEDESPSALGDLPTIEGEGPYYFGVKFPNLPGYLFDKMQLSIFFSVILLITVLFFTYATIVILKQKRLSELQKDFINNMTHEFKTPLSTIQIAADVFLANQAIQSNQRLLTYAQIIKDQNHRLNKQVEKVLQVVKLDRGLELKLEELSILEIWENITADAKMRVEQLNGQFFVHSLQDELTIQADRLHFTNILYSIIDNAFKYQKKAPVIKMSLKKLERDRKVVLSIEDEGIGIPREYQHRIFEKFFRIPVGDIHDVKGFGLGLFYVKKICDQHGWQIQLASEPGSGTTVTIILKY